MCMLWGEQGVLGAAAGGDGQGELDWAVTQKIFDFAQKAGASFILSGGEPLLYSRFHDLLKLIKASRCFSYICTNGIGVERFIKEIENNPYPIFYISVDGPKMIHDALRGEGSYDAAVKGIKALKSLKNAPYVGAQFTLQPENVHVLYETCRDLVKIGVDWILINLRWYLTFAQAKEYEECLSRNFHTCPTYQRGFISAYPLDKEEFVRQCRRIQSGRWPIQISSYLKEPEDIYPYVDEPYSNPYNQFCYKQWVRMDVLPNGEVTPCIQYPDIRVGDLKKNEVMEVWNSDCYSKFRVFVRKQLFSVCSKCYCLYLYDKKRMRL